jgi:Tfp pilus assembly protein FimT
MRSGLTLAELVLTCTFVGLVVGIAFPRMGDTLDRLRVTQAGHEVAGALTLGRAAAIRRGSYADVIIDEARGSVRVEAGSDTLFHRALRDLHRVQLRASKDTITFAPSGFGYGVSNSTIVVSLKARAETVTVSRLGRMRRSW